MWKEYNMARARVLESNSGAFNKNVHGLVVVQDTTTTRALVADQSGSLVILRATGGATNVNLPAASGNEGVYYEFMVNEALDGIVTIQAKDGTDFFLGTVFDGETATPANVAFDGAADDELIIASGAAAGEVYIKCVSDGDNWLVVGNAADVSDISAGQASSNV